VHEQSARGVHELKSTNKGPRTKVHEEKNSDGREKKSLGFS